MRKQDLRFPQCWYSRILVVWDVTVYSWVSRSQRFEGVLGSIKCTSSLSLSQCVWLQTAIKCCT